MKKRKYYLKKVGLPYFIMWLFDRTLFSKDNALFHNMMKLREKQVPKYVEKKQIELLLWRDVF